MLKKIINYVLQFLKKKNMDINLPKKKPRKKKANYSNIFYIPKYPKKSTLNTNILSNLPMHP